MLTKHTASKLAHQESKVCAKFSDAWNKPASVGRAAKGCECIGIMAFTADIVPEQKFTLASLFGPAYPTTTTSATTVSPTKASLSSSLSVALLIVTLCQNRDTADATASASNTTNNSVSSSISNVENIVRTHEKRHQQRHKKNLRSTLSGMKN
jgi:hypothetical protein